RLHVTGGFEINTTNTDFSEFENEQGNPGDLQEKSITVSNQNHAFLKVHNLGWNRHNFEVAASINMLNYMHTDSFSVDSVDHSQTIRFNPTILPSFTYFYDASNTRFPILIWAKVAYGIAPPTLWEVLRADGSINADLQPERGLNFELRARHRLRNRRFSAEINLYSFQLQDAILPTTLSTGETIFSNAGTTQQNGAEFLLEFIHKTPEMHLAFKGTSGLQFYSFGDYVKGGEDLGGNDLTGVPRATFGLHGFLNHNIGLSFHANANYTGRTPVNDDNSVYQDGYLLLSTKIAWNFHLLGEGDIWQKKIKLTPYIGGNNLLDARYSNFLQLNGFGGRLWNPAPARNFYAGLDLQF
ncbi:MAG: hypothetical protein AAF570_11235, partial [Bacteroidota bacterium]